MSKDGLGGKAKMRKKVLSRAWKPLVWGVLLFTLFIILDYVNLPSRLGIKINSMNTGFLGIVVDIMIAVTVFIITYHLIQEREIEKQENQKKIARHLIRTSMNLCETYIYDLDKPEISEMMLRVNHEENREIKEALTFFSEYEENPFEYDSTITQYIVSGVISDKAMERYERAKNSYKAYIYAFKVYGGDRDPEKERFLYNLKQTALEAIMKAK